jgi:hypothetical protein
MAPLTTHDIKETVAASVEATVPPAIQAHVNGHIKRVDAKIDDAKIQLEAVNQKLDGHIATTSAHREQQDKKWEEMEPLLEFGRTMGNIRKGIIWLMQPLQGIVIIIATLSGLFALIRHFV